MRKSRLLLPTRRDVVPTDPEELDYYSHLPKAVKKAVWERDRKISRDTTSLTTTLPRRT
jgi:hypothetical protein